MDSSTLQLLGLLEEPFSIAPDPAYCYLSEPHSSAIRAARSVIDSRQGLAVIFGDVGVGKTTVARRMYNGFDADRGRYAVAYLPNPLYGTPFEFLKEICRSFNVEPKASQIEQFGALQRFLLDQHDRKHVTILMIDESHLLSGAMLEVVRKLLNFELDVAKLLQVVLFGETVALLRKLKSKQALEDRIVGKGILDALDFVDTRKMIEWRLQVAGRRDPHLFTSAALRFIYESTRGYPRKVIVLCRSALELQVARAEAQVGPNGDIGPLLRNAQLDENLCGEVVRTINLQRRVETQEPLF